MSIIIPPAIVKRLNKRFKLEEKRYLADDNAERFGPFSSDYSGFRFDPTKYSGKPFRLTVVMKKKKQENFNEKRI